MLLILIVAIIISIILITVLALCKVSGRCSRSEESICNQCKYICFDPDKTKCDGFEPAE